MNDHDLHLDDETLSALLDGEAAGTDHVASCDQCSARLAALTEARDAVRAPVDELDEITRARLIRTALDAPPAQAPRSPRRARQWAVGLTAVAAVAGLVAFIGSVGSPSTNKTASVALSGSVRDAGSLGDVTSPDTLRAALQRDRGEVPKNYLSGGSTVADSAAGAGTGEPVPVAAAPQEQSNLSGQSAEITTSAAARSSFDRTAATVPAADLQRCASVVAAKLHPGRFVVRASALFKGELAGVVGFEQRVRGKTRLRVYVVDPSTCDVLEFAAV
jgi:hypothetical protein